MLLHEQLLAFTVGPSMRKQAVSKNLLTPPVEKGVRCKFIKRTHKLPIICTHRQYLSLKKW